MRTQPTRVVRTSLVRLALALLLTACGSTAAHNTPSGEAAPGTDSGDGGGLSIPSGTNGQGGGAGGVSGGTGGGSVSGGSTGSGGSVSTGGGAGTGGSGVGSGASSGAVPGVTPTTIYLGLSYSKNEQAGNCAVGACGAGDSGDERDAYGAILDEINKSGGILGRKLEPVWAQFDATSSQTVDQQQQAACATWTQDNEVFGIIGGQREVERQCAKNAGAVEFYAPTGSNSVPETFQTYPHYVEITGLNLVRLGSITIDGLDTMNYFGKDPKIGIVAWDSPPYHQSVNGGYVPALKRLGLELATDPQYVTVPQNLQDVGATSADVNSVVLKFANLGINHVMLLDGPAGVFKGGGLGIEFLQQAKSQQYYPRYGFNDNNLPVAGQQAGLYPNDQLKRSVSVGWLDSAASYDEGWHPNAARQRCEKFMREHGVDMSSENAHASAIGACEHLWFFQAVVAAMGDVPLTPDNFMAGVNALGSSYLSNGVYGTHFSPTQHDGVAALRNMRFMDSCTCYKYVSDPYEPG